MKNSLNQKELSFISQLELRQTYFFTRADIQKYFTSSNEMNVYLHRLKNKKRIIKLNKNKYVLVPVKAINNNWSEHPFIIIDEMMNGENYCIAGNAAANYWRLTDQIPVEYEVWNTKKHGMTTIFNARIRLRKKRKLPQHVTKKIYNHPFSIITKKEAKQ